MTQASEPSWPWSIEPASTIREADLSRHQAAFSGEVIAIDQLEAPDLTDDACRLFAFELLNEGLVNTVHEECLFDEAKA